MACGVRRICASQSIEIEEKSGSGAQGTVFLGHFQKTGIPCAVKVFSITENNKNNFYNEIIITQKLRSSNNIINIQKSFLYQSYGFVVMERMKVDLMDYILTHQRLSEKVAKKIFKQICEGIKHCHENKIVHLDIKPENILLGFTSSSNINNDTNISITIDDNNSQYHTMNNKPSVQIPSEVKMCDFGHSCDFSNLSIEDCEKLKNSTYVIGTQRYRAPEFSSASIYPTGNLCAADIWSLGIVLFVMVTGFFPHTVPQKEREYPIDLAETKVGLDSEINLNLEILKNFTSITCYDLVCAMLAMNPEERPPIDTILKHGWLRAKNSRSLSSKLFRISSLRFVSENGDVKSFSRSSKDLRSTVDYQKRSVLSD